MQMAFNDSFDFFPDLNAGIVLLTNKLDESSFMSLLTESYVGLAGESRPPPSSSEIRSVSPQAAGTYLDVSWGGAVELHGGQPLEETLFLPAESNEYLFRNGNPYLRFEVSSWTPNDPADYCGLYRDAFYPDVSSDLTISFEGAEWTVTDDEQTALATVVGTEALHSDFGLIEFHPGGLQLGRATVFVKD